MMEVIVERSYKIKIFKDGDIMIDWTKQTNSNMQQPYHYGIKCGFGFIGYNHTKDTKYRVTIIDPNGSPRILWLLGENDHRCERYIGTIKELNEKLEKYLKGKKCRTPKGLLSALAEYSNRCSSDHKICVLIEMV